MPNFSSDSSSASQLQSPALNNRPRSEMPEYPVPELLPTDKPEIHREVPWGTGSLVTEEGCFARSRE